MCLVGDSVRDSRRLRLLRGGCVSCLQFHVGSADSAAGNLETASADRYLWRCALRHRVARKVPRQCLDAK